MSELQPGNGSIDPTRRAGNVINPVVLNSETVQTLREAFDYEAADTWILHADARSAGASARFAQLSMDTLAELSTAQPDLIDGGSRNLQSVSRLYGLIDRSVGGTAPSFYRIPDMRRPDEVTKKKKFLTEAASCLHHFGANSDNAHTFHLLTQSAFGLLTESLRDGGTLELAGDSPVAQTITEVLEKQRQDTTQAQTRRAEKLKGTIFDSEARPEGLQHVELLPGNSVQVDWDSTKSVLNKEQTYEAFFVRLYTDVLSLQAEGFNGTTIATLEIDGNNYLVVDTRDAQKSWPGTGRYSKTGKSSYKGEAKAGQLKLLQIVGDKEDPRYGVKVFESDYDFEGKYSDAMQPVYGSTYVGEHGYRNARSKTGVMIGIDKKGRLVIDAADQSVRVTVAEGALKEASVEQLSPKETFDYQVKEVRKRLNDSMPDGHSDYVWAPDLLANLNRSVEEWQEKGGVPEDELSVITSADLINPRIWRNQHHAMDAVNLFLGKLGMANLDHVLGVVQDHVNQKFRQSQTEEGSGEVTFESGIPGVRTKIKYRYSQQGGKIDYIQPEILIDPKVEVAA